MHFRTTLQGIGSTLITLVCLTVCQAQTSTQVQLRPGATKIDEIGLYEVSWRYRNGDTGAMPIGWSGHFQDKTGISCTPFGRQAGRFVFLLHPPWRGGTGVTDQVFHLSLPTAKSILLRFAVAMKSGEVGPKSSDGATFRVFVNDNRLYEFNQTTANWAASTLDLTAYAGKNITLKFESDPGPKDNPSYDYAFWGDRTLEIAGNGNRSGRVAPLFGRAEAYESSAFAPSAAGSICPPVRKNAPEHLHLQTPKLTKGITQFLPLMQFTSDRNPAVHSAIYGVGAGAYYDLIGGDGKEVRSDAATVSRKIEVTKRATSIRVKLVFVAAGRTIHIEENYSLTAGDYIKAEVRAGEPYVAAVHFGAIGPAAFRRQAAVPYYGFVQFLPDAGLFANVIPDHKRSSASMLQPDQAVYAPLTDGSRRLASETVYYALSPCLTCVLPVPGNPASPFRSALSSRIVLDSWSGNYKDNAEYLKLLASYRITNLLTIAHVWQNGGYDNKLPDVLPAFQPLGGDEGMRLWATTASTLGELFALHENYVDFYPNAPSWNEEDVARDATGNKETAWLNEGTGIQSYAVAPDSILKYARRITPEVQSRFKPNASYLDVHSAVPPWFHVDFRANRSGSGMFQTVWNAHRDLWKLFRDTHRGPVLGEGNNHWYWSGLLDGVEAQFGSGIEGNSGLEAPMMVDFDLQAIHPLQFNHGMGYLERWLPADFDKVWHSRIPPTTMLDRYRMQEIAYGHAGFIASPFERSLPFIWQEHHLVGPLAAAYAQSRIRRIEYQVNDRYVGVERAIAEGSSFDRVHLVYENGLQIWLNGQSTAWRPVASGPILPQYGWYALGAGIEAGTVLRRSDTGTQIVSDMCRTPRSVFINARSVVADPPHALPVHPYADKFAQSGSRKFRLQFCWEVNATVPKGYVVFIHATGASGVGKEQISFQPASGIASPPSTWVRGDVIRGDTVDISLPESLPDGDYTLKAGLYSPDTGDRLRLTGFEDETSRIVLGKVRVADNGAVLTWTKAPDRSPGDTRGKQWAEHTNPTGSTVDFGVAATNGSLLMEQEAAGAWMVTPYPRDTVIKVRFAVREPGKLSKVVRLQALDTNGKAIGNLKPDKSAATTFLLGEIPGAVRYRMSRP